MAITATCVRVVTPPQGERTQNDGKQIQVEEGLALWPVNQSTAVMNATHGPGFDREPGPGESGKECPGAERHDGQREDEKKSGDRPGLLDQRTGPYEHQRGQRK